MTRNLAHSILGIVFAAGLLSVVPSASAQQTVNVPFAFSVNHHTLPAGSYKVDLSSPAFVTLINRNSPKLAGTFLVRQASGWAIETQGRLTFRRTGSGMILTQVWVAGSNIHGDLAAPPKGKRELAAGESASGPSAIEIAIK